MKLKYNYDFLIKYCNDNNVKLLKDYSNEHVNINFKICAECSNKNCLNKFEKSVEVLLRNTLCEKCTAKKRLETLEKNNMKKYGAKNVFETNEVKKKIKEKILVKYGVENPSQANEIKEKKKRAAIEKFGVNCVLQSEQVIQKTKITNIKKYGCENVSQNSSISEKQQKSYKLKDYILPSGKILKYQGYEKYCLDSLLKNDKINENDIETSRKNVPELWYNDSKGKRRRHFVDIYIKSLKKCIEVKSTWTLKKHYDKVFAKQTFAKQEGYLYEIYVFDSKGKLVEKYS
jgi:hypothetical protein